MSFCPNKSSKEYKALVSQLGEANAYNAWYLKNKELLLNTPVSVKPGVAELFDSNPELSEIGTTEQYSAYLDSIFPDSQVKDILYHGTFNKFDKFKNTKDFGFHFAKDINISLNALYRIYSGNIFTSEEDYNKWLAKGNKKKDILPVLLNIHKLKQVKDLQNWSPPQARVNNRFDWRTRLQG